MTAKKERFFCVNNIDAYSLSVRTPGGQTVLYQLTSVQICYTIILQTKTNHIDLAANTTRQREHAILITSVHISYIL